MRSNSELSVVAIIEFEGGAVQVDVAMVAKGLRIKLSFVHESMRDGTITTLCERGIDEDEGHHRLTSFRRIGVFASSSTKEGTWFRVRRF